MSQNWLILLLKTETLVWLFFLFCESGIFKSKLQVKLFRNAIFFLEDEFVCLAVKLRCIVCLGYQKSSYPAVKYMNKQFYTNNHISCSFYRYVMWMFHWSQNQIQIPGSHQTPQTRIQKHSSQSLTWHPPAAACQAIRWMWTGHHGLQNHWGYHPEWGKRLSVRIEPSTSAVDTNASL